MTSIRIDQISQLLDHSLVVASFAMLTPYTLSPGSEAEFNVVAGGISTIDRFKADLQQSELVRNPPQDVNELFDCYSDTLRHLYRHSCPRGYGDIVCRPTAPWFDTE